MLSHTRSSNKNAYFGSSVFIIKVVRVLPNIDAEEGDMRHERVLVGCRHNLDRLVLGKALYQSHDKNDKDNVPINNGQTTTVDRKNKRTSQHHPEPWIPFAAVLNSSLNASKDPKVSTMALFNEGPLSGLPPIPSLLWTAEGAKLVQKREWLM